MAQDYAAQIQGRAVRITRLAPDGTLLTGPKASYLLKGFTELTYTEEREEGEEVTQKNANGEVCVSYQTPDVLKRVTVSLTICRPDVEFTELLVGGTILADDDDPNTSLGYAAPFAGVDANPNGCALEIWADAITSGGKPASVNPYWHHVLPYVRMHTSGDKTFANATVSLPSFEGWGVGNAQFGQGPDDSWPFISDRPYQYARTSVAPVLQADGYKTVT